MIKDRPSIVPIENKDDVNRKPAHPNQLGCRIKVNDFEASFYNHVEERILQSVLKEAAKHAR